MYKVMVLISVFIRQYMIPNPFQILGDEVTIMVNHNTWRISTVMLNLFAELLIFWCTRIVVKLYYDNSSEAVVGSFLYLIFYCIHIFILYLFAVVQFNVFVMTGILTLYVSMHVWLRFSRNSILW